MDWTQILIYLFTLMIFIAIALLPILVIIKMVKMVYRTLHRAITPAPAK